MVRSFTVTLITPLVCFFLGASGVALGSNFREITSGADLMLCKGVEQYQSSLNVSSTRHTVSFKNDFPFNVELIHWSESVWDKSPVLKGGEIGLSLAPRSVVLAIDPSIGMCIGASTTDEQAAGPISLSQVLSDFDGEKLLALRNPSPKSPQVRSPDCNYAGYVALDFGLGKTGQTYTIDEMKVCLNSAPDGASVPLSGDLSVMNLSAGNIAGLRNFAFLVESAAQCDHIDETSAAEYKDQLVDGQLAMALLQQFANEAIKGGLTHWVKGRDKGWDTYVKLVLRTNLTADELMQDFKAVMAKPEFNGPCMCDKLPVSC